MVSSRPNRLLFLAFPFPPSRAIAAVRAWYVAKCLAQRGWEITVVTPDPRLLVNPDPHVDMARDCKRLGIWRLYTDIEWRFLYGGWFKARSWEVRRFPGRALRRAAVRMGLDTGVGWNGPAWRACLKIQPREVDLILATGSPFSAFALARRLARRLGVPYVLDYRDLWSDSPRSRRVLMGSLVRRHESSLIRGAAGVITVSESCAESLERSFDLMRRPEVVTNGFDPEDLAGVVPMAFDDDALVYAGTFEPPARSAEPLIDLVMRANAVRHPSSRIIRLHYFGGYGKYLGVVARSKGAESLVVDHGFVPRREVFAALKGALAAAVVTAVHDEGSLETRGILTGKLFEALGLGVPVLLIAPRGSEAAKIVEETGSGAHFLGSQVLEAGSWLASLRAVPIRRDEELVRTFSWTAIAARLDGVLRGCLERPPAEPRAAGTDQ